MKAQYFYIGGLIWKFDSNFLLPSRANINEFNIDCVDGEYDIHVEVLPDKEIFMDIDTVIHYQDNFIKIIKNNNDEYVLLSYPDGDCYISSIKININRKNVFVYVNINLISDDNIHIIESTPFLMCFMIIMLQFKGTVIHSNATIINEKGFIFCGHSGAGKTTISKLLSGFKNNIVLTDETAILRINNDAIYVYGSPWKGSGANFFCRKYSKLSRIFYLKHGNDNYIRELSSKNSIELLVKQAFPFFWDKLYMIKNINILNNIVNQIKSCELYFLPDDSSVNYLKTILKDE
jgi:hypothetical protein